METSGDMISFHADNFHLLCDELVKKDSSLAAIVESYGYPPMWTRPQGFASLVHIILEQQVSLASARAAFNKLCEKIGVITPANLMRLSDEEMRACYFSRQKMKYVRHLSEMLLSGELQLEQFSRATQDDIRRKLKSVKGIGDWTVDVYLIFALQRTDIFPIGDLALVQAMKDIKNLPKEVSRDELITISVLWSPYRSIASFLLWHYYLRKKGINIQPA